MTRTKLSLHMLTLSLVLSLLKNPLMVSLSNHEPPKSASFDELSMSGI